MTRVIIIVVIFYLFCNMIKPKNKIMRAYDFSRGMTFKIYLALVIVLVVVLAIFS